MRDAIRSGWKLEVLEFLTDAGELDRLAGDLAEAQRRTAAGVTVELGQDRAGDAQRFVEVRGHADGLLSGGGIEHEQNLARLNPVTQADKFLHQRLVDLQPAGCVEDDHVDAVLLGLGHRSVGDLIDVLFAAHQEAGEVELLGQRLELIHGGRSIDVGTDEQWLAVFSREESC